MDAATVALTAASGREVTSARVAGDTGDILLMFGPDVRFDIFVNSSGYESRDPSLSDGRRFIALGGGEVASITGAS